MTNRDLGWLLICAGAILAGVQLVPHLTDAGAGLLACLVGGLIAWAFGGTYRPG